MDKTEFSKIMENQLKMSQDKATEYKDLSDNISNYYKGRINILELVIELIKMVD